MAEADLTCYPYVSFEHAPGVAADFSEEYPEMSLKRPDRWIHVNSRATMMNVLTRTDAYTTGSGLLVESSISQAVVTVPLADKSPVRIGWIVPRSSRLSPRTEAFVRLLEASVADAIRFTDRLHRSLGAGAAGGEE